MTILPETESSRRKKFRGWYWREWIGYFYIATGAVWLLFFCAHVLGLSGKALFPAGLIAGLVAGIYAGHRGGNDLLQRLGRCRIEIEGETFRIVGLARGAILDIRFRISEVESVFVGRSRRSALIRHHPLISNLDSQSLTVVERSGDSISFGFGFSIFRAEDIVEFFGYLRARGVNVPTATQA